MSNNKTISICVLLLIFAVIFTITYKPTINDMAGIECLGGVLYYSGNGRSSSYLAPAYNIDGSIKLCDHTK